MTPRTIRSLPERLEQPAKLVAPDIGVLGEVGRLVRELAPEGVTSWRTTRAAASCSASGMRSSAPCTCSRTTARAPPISRRVASRSSREPALALPLPEPLEDELKVRRLDAGVGPDLVEHRLDERVLRRERLARQLAVALERAEDRGPSLVAVEPVEAQQVPEQLRDPAGEVVELGESVVPEREQHVDAETGSAQQVGECVAEGALVPWYSAYSSKLSSSRCSSPLC